MSSNTKNSKIALRGEIVLLKALGWKTTDIMNLLGLPKATIDRTYQQACRRGFDPAARPLVVRDEHVRDLPRSGRPTKQTEETKEEIIKRFRQGRHGRDKTCADISAEMKAIGVDVSSSTVWRVLKS